MSIHQKLYALQNKDGSDLYKFIDTEFCTVLCINNYSLACILKVSCWG